MRIGTPLRLGPARPAAHHADPARIQPLGANQTLEDYALRFTAKSARKWSALRVANTALGAVSFLALEAIGGTITLAYGFQNSILAIAFVSVMIFLISIPICAMRRGPGSMSISSPAAPASAISARPSPR